MEHNSRYKRAADISFILLLLTGISLRLYMYLGGRSFNEEESAFALHLINNTCRELLNPLPAAHPAPVFFLVILKLIASLFGYGELVLRAFPFLVSLISFPLLYFILLRLSKSTVISLFIFCAFAVNSTCVYYSSALHPVSLDISLVLILAFFALSPLDFVAKRRNTLLLIFGCLGILLSDIVFIVLLVVACFMLWRWYSAGKTGRQGPAVVVWWCFVFGWNYFLFLYPASYTANLISRYAKVEFNPRIKKIKPSLDYLINLHGNEFYCCGAEKACEYYYQVGYLKIRPGKIVDEQTFSEEFFSAISNEKKNSVLLYDKSASFPYNAVKDELEKQKLLLLFFEFKGYGLFEIKSMYDPNSPPYIMDYTYFDSTLTMPEDSSVALWGGSIVSKPLRLKPGRYNMSVLSRGTPALGIYPELSVYINNNKIGTCITPKTFRHKLLSFELKNDTAIVVKLNMENDFLSDTEDRNSFIKNVFIRKE